MNNFAITSAGIGEAMQRSASALYEAGNTIDESIGLVTAANSVIQNPEQVGTALKTLALRIRGVKTELEEAGLETEGMAETTSQLQAKIKALTNGKVDIMLNADEFKSTTQILREMSAEWQHMTDVQRAAALELLGGKRQANILSSLISNFQTVEDVIQTSMNSEGSAYAENAKWLDSIEGKTTQLTNSMQDLWNKTLKSDVIKFFLDLAKGIVDVTKNVGLLKTAFAAFVGYKAFSTKTNFGNIIQFLQSATSGVTGVKAKFSAIGAALQEVNVGAKLASIGVQALNAAFSTLLTIGIAFAIQGLITLFYNLATATQRAMESASEAVNEYKNTTASLADQKKTVDELASTYQKLASGVNTETNTNIGLTTESYQEYLDVCNQIADIYPELVTGYDAQGNAILSLKGKVDELTNSYRQAQEEAASTLLTDKNKKDIWTTYENTAGKVIAEGTIEDGTKYIKTTVADQRKILKSIASMTDSELSQMYEYDKAGNAAMWDILREQLKETGSYIDDATMMNAFNELNINTGVSLDEYKSTLKSKFTDINKEVSSGINGMREALSAKLVFDATYNNESFSNESRGIVQSIINNITPDMISQAGADSVDEVYEWFSTNVIEKIANADYQDLFTNINSISDELAKAMASEDSNAFNDAKSRFNEMVQDWADAEGNIQIDPDADVVTQYLQKLAKGIQEQSKNYEVKLQMQTEFESPTKVNELITKYTGNYQKEIQDAFDGLELGDNATMKDVYGKISEALAGEDGIFSSDEFSDFYDQYAKALASGDTSLQTLKDNGWSDAQIQAIQAVDAAMKLYGTDINTVKSLLIELGYVAPSLKDIGVFDFSSESTQKQIEQFESDIKSIKEAWNSLNDGDMTKSEFIELAMEFPDLMNGVNLSDDNWMVKAKQNLEELYNTTFTGENGFITSLEKQKQAMEAEGQDTSQLDSFLNYAYQLQNMSLLDEEANTIPNTISEIESAYENYKNIIEETNEVLYDGQKVSDDYYNSLKDYIDDVEALDSCFDKNNKRIVTNANKLKQLIAQQKNQTKSTIGMARAQAQLQYRKLLNELLAVTNGTKTLNSAQIQQVNSLQEQINTVQTAINDYKLLELELSNATKAFDEYQKAKEKESSTDYESTTLDMIESVMNGFDTGDVGSESFIAAAKGLLNESITGVLNTAEDLDRVWEEMTTGNMSKFFTYTDDQFEITLGNLQNFVATAQEQGLMWGTTFDEFGIEAGVSLDEFSKKLGLSKDAVMAFLDMLSDKTIGGEKLWGDLADFQGIEAIDEATDSLNNLLQKRAELQKSGSYNGELEAEIIAAQDAVNAKYDETISKVDKYTSSVRMANAVNPNSGVTYSNEELEQIQEDYNKLFGTKYSFDIDNGKLVASDELINTILTKKDKLEVPVEGEITFRYQEALSQIEELKKKKSELEEASDSEFFIKYGTSDRSQLLANINSDIAEAEEQAKILEVQYGLKPSTEEDTTIIEKFEDLEENGVNTTVNADTTQATQDVNTFKQNASEPIETTLTVNTVTGTTTVESTGNSDATINFKETGYQDVVNKLTSLTAQTKVPIDQAVDVDDNNTIQEVSNDLINLDNQTVENKTFNISMSGYYTVTSELDKITDKLTEIDGKTATATVTINTVKSGKASAMGNVDNAYAGGTNSISKADKNALVGELGPETVVDPIAGKYYTVGENGAEFVNLPRGAIVFNHKQTKELFTNGRTASRGKMVNGSAFAEGNAYAETYIKHYNWTDTQNTAGAFNTGNWDAAANNISDASDSLSNAADSLSDSTDEFEEVFDWIEVRIEEIDEKISLLEASLENAAYYNEKNNIIDSIINLNNTKLSNLKAGYEEYAEYAAKLLTEIPENLRDAAQNGAIAIEKFVGEADEATVEAINNYREWAQKAADLKQQVEEIVSTIRDLAIDKFNNAKESGDVRITVEDSQTEKLQNAVDLIEDKGMIANQAYYTAMMENSNKKIEYQTAALKAAQKAFDDAVKAGQIERGSNEWYELVDELYQMQSVIDESTAELEEFQNAINDIYWDNFDELINRIDYLNNETQSLIDLMDSADMVTKPEGRTYEGGTVKFWTADDVQWTEEGIATLGLYAQQMEIAEYKARQYAEAIDDLQKDYQKGLYSENEYLEKLDELTQNQYDAIESYYDAQDAIKDLNQTRIDSIKDGIQKEIDAYSELIDKKKEELESEKDLYDFQKSTAEQTKNIADIQRKLMALSTDNSASATAKRKKLEQELAEANADLESSYYDRSISDRQDALDKELEDFQTQKDAEIEKWEEYLENIEQVVADSLGIVQANASGVYDTLSSKAEEYNLTLSDAIMTPWQDGAFAVSDYQTTFDTAMSSTMDQLEAIKAKWQEIIDKMAEAAAADVAYKNRQNASYASATYTKPAQTTSKPSTSNSTNTTAKAITVGGKINAGNATIYGNSSGGGGGKQYFSSDPIYVVLAEENGYLKVRHHSLSSGVTGFFKKSDVKALASGTKKLDKSGIVNIDELGEELVIGAKNGRLTYLEKGSGVIPADITSNLMAWGELDPQDMLDRNRPSIGVSPEVHNTEINLNVSYGDILHIEEFNGDDPDEIAKIVAKQFEKHTRDLNNSLRKYVR